MSRKMKIEVGQIKTARFTDNDLIFRFQIVSKVKLNGKEYYVGVKLGIKTFTNSYDAVIFDDGGVQVNDDLGMHYYLTGTSKSKFNYLA